MYVYMSMYVYTHTFITPIKKKRNLIITTQINVFIEEISMYVYESYGDNSLFSHYHESFKKKKNRAGLLM